MADGGSTSHPMCARCGGACCEAVAIDLGPLIDNSDMQRFLEFRTKPQVRDIEGKRKLLRLFEARCLMLKDGRCCAYEQRPMICQMFEPGGEACRTTVQSRRAPDEAAAILGE